MNTLSRIAVLFLLSSAAFGAEPIVTLVAPSAPLAAGGQASIDLIVLNPHGEPLEHTPPAERVSRLESAGHSWLVTLRLSGEAGSRSVQGGGFARERYVFDLPPALRERALLELDSLAGVRAVLDVAEPEALAAQESQSPAAEKTDDVPPASRGALVPRPAAANIERAFRQHFGIHEPVYFIFGPDRPAAKFQLSFKYRIFGDAADNPEATRNSLQFGYTQRSIWDITADSSPFLDTSYMPELFYEHLTPEDLKPGKLKWLGVQAGYKHESNGRDGFNSRSLNTLYLRSAVAIGKLDGWRVVVQPRVYTFVSDMSDNDDIKRYRGYGDLRVLIGKNDGSELVLTGRLGSDRKYGSIQADLTIPLRFRLGDFASYFLVQYFRGYGESLLYYSEETESIRGGFSFVR